MVAGFGVGVTFAVCPIYLAEIADKNVRGMLGTFCSYDDVIPDLLKQPKVHLTDLSAYTSSQTDPRSSLLPHILLPYLLSTHQIPRNLLVSLIIPSSALFSSLFLFSSPLFCSLLFLFSSLLLCSLLFSPLLVP